MTLPRLAASTRPSTVRRSGRPTDGGPRLTNRIDLRSRETAQLRGQRVQRIQRDAGRSSRQLRCALHPAAVPHIHGGGLGLAQQADLTGKASRASSALPITTRSLGPHVMNLRRFRAGSVIPAACRRVIVVKVIANNHIVRAASRLPKRANVERFVEVRCVPVDADELRGRQSTTSSSLTSKSAACRSDDRFVAVITVTSTRTTSVPARNRHGLLDPERLDRHLVGE